MVISDIVKQYNEAGSALIRIQMHVCTDFQQMQSAIWM